MTTIPAKGESCLFVGGVRCGKTEAAQRWLETRRPRSLYVAVCQPRDEETVARVARHKAARGKRWSCVEEPIDIAAALKLFFRGRDPSEWGVLIDCLSMWLANLLEARASEEEIFNCLDAALTYLEKLGAPFAVVSAECGLGFVPLDPLARKYGDLLGLLNQECARRCASVRLIVCGLALPLKL